MSIFPIKFSAGRGWIYFTLLLLLVGCGGSDYYKQAFRGGSPNMKAFAYPPDKTWKAVIRATLAHNFTIEEEDGANMSLQASKCYQKGDRMIHLLLAVRVQGLQGGGSVLYVNAIQTTRRLYVKKEYWKFLIIPTPFTKSKEAEVVKEEEKTIEDKDFYRNFFEAVEEELNRIEG